MCPACANGENIAWLAAAHTILNAAVYVGEKTAAKVVFLELQSQQLLATLSTMLPKTAAAAAAAL